MSGWIQVIISCIAVYLSYLMYKIMKAKKIVETTTRKETQSETIIEDGVENYIGKENEKRKLKDINESYIYDLAYHDDFFIRWKAANKLIDTSKNETMIKNLTYHGNYFVRKKAANKLLLRNI